MTTSAHPVTRPPNARPEIRAVLRRLARLHAGATTLQGVLDSLDGSDDGRTLLALLDDLERDLLLASREVGDVRTRIDDAERFLG